LLAALRSRSRFQNRSSERSWLVGILKHKIADFFRKKSRETSFTDLAFFSGEQEEKFDADGFWFHHTEPTGWGASATEGIERSEFWSAFQSCVSKLPERIAQVFLMRELDDVPSKQVCADLQISDSNLWVMLHRARMALRQCLEGSYFSSTAGGA
jgi:RNA polymerase sigma-70 factor (ECF subfamily)